MSKVLGLIWDKDQDTLKFEIPDLKEDEVMSKRNVLSIMQKIFDPIGSLCPVLLDPKKIIQDTWDLKLKWDEELQMEIKTRFYHWLKELSHLRSLQFPRNVGGGSNRATWQIHAFGDASQDAYASCIFLRTGHPGNIKVQLLQAKSRVASLQKGKRATILRLELLACTISTRLCKAIKEALSISDDVPKYFWSDSTTALAWIKRNDEWGTFVGNRVREICRLSSVKVKDWRHVPGVHNPADPPSRGCSPIQLMDSKWWEGPSWLKLSPAGWPVEEVKVNEGLVFEEKKKRSVGMAVATEPPFFPSLPFSSYRRNVRVVSYVLRFVHNIKKSTLAVKLIGPIDTEEYPAAERVLLKSVQDECFTSGDVISGLQVEKRMDDLIHVKTKLLYCQDSEDFRYPVLLPKSHPIVEQIIKQEHQRSCHSGIQFLMSSLRERFWIIQSRRAIRTVVNKCVRCRRFSAVKQQPVPSPLPEDRVKSSKVFEITGVDLAGPLYVKVGSWKVQKKVWIVMFTCAVYRCVHLKLVESLSTENFLDAFSNFISRRGRPAVIYKDNGTNFVGADNALKNWQTLMEHPAADGIKWKFNPPSAAWWVRFLERLIRSVKDLLKRMLGYAKLTYSKLSNMLIKIEAVINGRPLTTVTEDPEDLVPLTPAIFLHEIPCTNTEDLDACGFQRVNQERKDVLEEFKMRFRNEYLGILVQRGFGKPVKFKVSDVVLVGSDNQKRQEWPMAKIVEVFPGKDEHLRVVKVTTANGYLTPAVQRIYPLEVSNPEEIPEVKEKEKKPSELYTKFCRKIVLPKRFKD